MYYCFEIVRIEKLGMHLKLCLKLRFKVILRFYGTNTLQVVQTRFVWHETRHKIVFSIYYYFEKVRIAKLGICLKLRSNLRF